MAGCGPSTAKPEDSCNYGCCTFVKKWYETVQGARKSADAADSVLKVDICEKCGGLFSSSGSLLPMIVLGAKDKMGQIIQQVYLAGEDYTIYRTRQGVLVNFADCRVREREQRACYAQISEKLCRSRFLTSQMARWPFGLNRNGGFYDHQIGEAMNLAVQVKKDKTGETSDLNKATEILNSGLPVAFPEEFGSIPTVALSFGPTGPAAGASLAANSISPNGFTPAVTGAFTLSNGAPTNKMFANWIAVGPGLRKGTATASYLVLTVIYAPPGTNNGQSKSSVVYSNESMAGIQTSASQSFGKANTLSFKGSGGFIGEGGVGFDFVDSSDVTDTQSLDIKKSTTTTLTRPGPAQDGVNHDEDEIWLLLSPTVDLAPSESSALWSLTSSPKSPIQYVQVGWLNGHQPMPPGTATLLQAAGITAKEYPCILARDPLATQADGITSKDYPCILTSAGPSPLQSARFEFLGTYPYEPPGSANDPVTPVTTQISDSSIQTNGKTIEDTYKVGLSLSTGADFLGFAKAKGVASY